jgi:hypothetical protein
LLVHIFLGILEVLEVLLFAVCLFPVAAEVIRSVVVLIVASPVVKVIRTWNSRLTALPLLFPPEASSLLPRKEVNNLQHY